MSYVVDAELVAAAVGDVTSTKTVGSSTSFDPGALARLMYLQVAYQRLRMSMYVCTFVSSVISMYVRTFDEQMS